MAAIAAKLDPTSEKRAQVRQTKNQLQTLEKEEAALGDLTNMREGEAKHTAYQDIQSSKATALKAMFALEPSSETFKNYTIAKRESGEKGYADMVIPADPDEIAQEQAELKAQKALAREQKRLQKTRSKLMANAPAPMAGKRGTIKYDNI